MFERFELSIADYKRYYKDDDWYHSLKVLIIYDSEDNKTYCYCRNDFKDIDEAVARFVLQGNDLILDLENCNFRQCKKLERRCSTFGQCIKWKIKYNDKNKPSKEIFIKNGVTHHFYDLISVLGKYFVDIPFFVIHKTSEYNELIYKKKAILKTPATWNDKDKTLIELNKLTEYINKFKGKRNFGKWEKINYGKYIVYDDVTQQFKKDVILLAYRCEDLTLFDDDDFVELLELYVHYDMKHILEKYPKPPFDNRSAILMLLLYLDEYLDDNLITSELFEKALKDGKIIKILEFIKEYNHF